jgi:CO dehydrogenase/acetyl-CoA synthase beta subunit
MTDEFLSEQVLHSYEGDRVKQCDLYKSLFVPKQYGRDDIRIDDIQGNATAATAVCGDFATNVTTKFTLVNNGAGWKIARTA